MIVSKHATFTAGGLPTGSFALVAAEFGERDRVLCPSVSERYRQLERPLELFEAVSDRIGIKLEAHGISDRSAIWGRFRVATGRRVVGETFDYSLTLIERPLRGFLARAHHIRLSCANGATTRFGEAILSPRHIGESLDDRLMLSMDSFDRVPAEIEAHGRIIEALKDRTVTAEEEVNIFTLAARPGLETLEGADLFRRQRVTEKLDELLPRTHRYLHDYRYGNGAEPGTAWGVYNALNYRREFDADAKSERKDLVLLSHLVPALAALQ